jgi:hypothetical protein
MVEYRVRYDNAEGWSPGKHALNVTVDVKRNMHAPIYVYYELDNFHQVTNPCLARLVISIAATATVVHVYDTTS